MLQTRNDEHRRLWNNRGEQAYWPEHLDSERHAYRDDGVDRYDRCLSCGDDIVSWAGMASRDDSGVWFCDECASRSRASLLDELYDDLGVAD